MAAGRIIWDGTGEKEFERGVDRGVVYPYDKETSSYTNGEAWNGLTNINESPSGAEANKQYADNIEYANLTSKEEFGATVEAFMYPDTFAVIDGTKELVPGVAVHQQNRKLFGLCYRTGIGNDVDERAGYKLHLVYGCKASPSEKSYATENDSPEIITFSWEVSTTPVNVGTINGIEYEPTSLITIDSTKFTTPELKARLKTLEDLLYGTDADTEAGTAATVPTLPLPSRVYSILTGTNNG